MHIPCVIVTRGYEPPPVLLELSNKFGVPVMTTPDVTMSFMNSIRRSLRPRRKSLRANMCSR